MRERMMMCLAAAALTAGSVANAQPDLEPARYIALGAGPGAMAPSIAAAPGSDEVVLTWLEPVNSDDSSADRRPRLWDFKMAVSRDGSTWSDPQTVLSSTQLFVNWADVPGVAIDERGQVWSYHLERSGGAGTYAYHVVLQQRHETDGSAWARLGPVHDDRTHTEHGFVSFAPGATGIHIFWLDGRNMTGGHGHDDAQGTMTLRTRTLSPTFGQMSDEVVLDERVCECCGTDAAMTADGPIIVYRDRSEDETRDIACVRLVNGHWTPPVTVHDDGWVIPGCPVNGPAIAAADRRVLVGWFSGAEVSMGVKCAISNDAGASFEKILMLDEPGADGRSTPDGRVDVAIDPSGRFGFVLWLDRAHTDEQIDLELKPDYESDYANDLDGVIRLAMLDLEKGSIVSTCTLTRTSSARSSGFPKIVHRSQGTLLVVWTNTIVPQSLAACEVRYSVR